MVVPFQSASAACEDYFGTIRCIDVGGWSDCSGGYWYQGFSLWFDGGPTGNDCDWLCGSPSMEYWFEIYIVCDEDEFIAFGEMCCYEY
jgi:hypothetical protein